MSHKSSQNSRPIARARVLHEESLALYRELGDKAGMASALNNLGTISQEQGDYIRARRPLEESLALLEELGDRRGFARTLHNLGMVVHEQGDVAQARALIEKSLALRRELGDADGMARALLELGIVAEEQGDPGGAFSLIAQSLALRQEMSERRGIAECLEALAHLATAPESSSDVMERAARLLGAAAVLRTTLGAPLVPADQTRYDYTVATLRASIGERAYASARAVGQELSLEQAVASVLGMLPGEENSLTARPPLPRQLAQ